MKRFSIFHLATSLLILALIGCSGSPDNPISTTPDNPQSINNPGSGHTQLWGYWDVYIDVENMTVEAVPDRHGMFTANVVNFLNGNPANLQFALNEVVPGPGYLDIDIDVSLRHPFPGMLQYNGYDVRGVFMGDGSSSLETNSDLVYSVNGNDQFMLADPDDGIGGPDGYTRWFNISEFAPNVMPLLEYTQGKFASPGFDGTATLCPYRYFADGLGKNDDLWTWLNANPYSHGVFNAGSINSRNYYLRFPDTKGVIFGYAVTANWEAPDVHPSHAPETIGCDVEDNSNVWYLDPSQNGGKIDLDISLWDWGVKSAGVGEYVISIESTVLSVPHPLDPGEMTPIGGTDNYSTYHVEIPADQITGSENQEYWILVEYDNFDYTNELGAPNDAWEDALTACFRYDLDVPSETECNDWVPVVDTLNGETDYLAVTREYTGWTVEGDNFEDGDPGVAVREGTNEVAVATNVQWIDQNNISFDIDLTNVPVGTYDIVVINGCGAQEEGIGEDLLTVLRWIQPVGDTNIDVISGYDDPMDIAIDPSSDQVGISYSDYWVEWSDDYTSESSPVNSWLNWATGQYVQMWYWDAQPQIIFYAHDAAPWYTGQNECWSWTDWTEWQSTHSQWQPGPDNEMKDIANVQGSIELWGVYDWANSSGGPHCSLISTYADYLINYPAHMAAPFYDGTGTSGVVLDNLIAVDFAESVLPYRNIYFMESLPSSETAVVELWQVNVNSPSIEQPTYMDISFGEDLLYDPVDITVDSSYYVYILETDSSGDPMIWAYDDAGVLTGWTEALDSDAMSGDPLRLDAHLSKTPDEVHALHSGGVTRFAME